MGAPCYQLGCSLLGAPVTGAAAPKCGQVLLATSQAALYRAPGHWYGCSAMLGCTHTTVSVGAATKRGVAKDMALHVQYLLKSILCNSHKQIQQLMTSGSGSPFPFILESLPRVSSQLSNHQSHWTPVDQ